MPDYVVCTRAIKGGSFPSEPGQERVLQVPCPQSRIITKPLGENRRITPKLPSNSALSQRCPEFMLQHAKPPATPNHDTNRKRKLELRPPPQAAASSAKPRIVAHHRSTNLLAPSNVKRAEVAPLGGRVGLPENAPAKAVGVDCGARFLKTNPVTNPVVDPISHGWYFDDPVFLKDLTFTLAGDMDRNVIPTRVATPTLSLAEK